MSTDYKQLEEDKKILAELLDASKSFPRRDFLRDLESKAQKKWVEEKIFEANAPAEDDGRETYFVNFPYPYMNGRLHLGHCFSLSKLDFSANFQRLKGKNVLFPFGLHCTGMPIKTSADKIKNEIAQYGNPPNFPAPKVALHEEKKPEPDAKKKRKGPSKVAAKSGGISYQWQIMESLGLTEDEIPAFAETDRWLDYFPPNCVNDMKAYGLGVDWRRSFITTDKNPFYDSFIRWQMTTLKAKNKIAFGKRNTVFSTLDGQPCMDHDRASGEGVGITEYFGIKLEVLELPKPLSELQGYKVYFTCATLRPETMYGQTNCYVHPDIEYGVYEIGEKEAFVCTPHASRNMAYQLDTTAGFGNIKELMRVQGVDLIGTPLKAPLTSFEKIYTFPMLTIIDTMGTGIVTCVPSDSPDDYVNFMALKNKPEWRAKWGVTDEMIESFEPVPIINIPGIGELSAEISCELFKVQGPKDAPKLAEAKKLCYDKGFHDGVMLVGTHKGKPVHVAKAEVGKELLEQGFAFKYSETAEKIVSRSGDTCIVAKVDQWYVDYGQEEWTNEVLALLKKMTFFEEDTRAQFEGQIKRLHEWACSRSFGLGTRIPWDEQFLVESLSDSTIYMAYYTLAHLLQGENNLEGTKGGPLGIKPEQMTMEVWNYIFLDGPVPATDISEASLNLLKREFTYWYPFNMRSSGKDLINNHLSFCLFTHQAIWGEKYFPKSIRCNGHLKLNSAKMSKSTGNFLTVMDSVRAFGADATRLALADAGDTVDDANVAYNTVSKIILRLTAFNDMLRESLAKMNTFRTGEYNYFDKMFDNYMNHHIQKAEIALEECLFHDALKYCLFEYSSALGLYRELCADTPLHKELIERYLKSQVIMLSIFCPHFCEEMWSLLGGEGSVLLTTWPETSQIDINMFAATSHVSYVANDIRSRMQFLSDPKKKQKGKEGPPTKLQLYVATGYRKENKLVMQMLEKLYNEDRDTYNNKKEIMKMISSNPDLKPLTKKLMPFIAFTQAEVNKKGVEVLSTDLKFDELALLSEMKYYLQRTVPISSVEIVSFDPVTSDCKDKTIQAKCDPLNPVPLFLWE